MDNPASLLTKFRRFALFSLVAFSFGGFAFYAGVVVPIGSAELGSTTQGFVTRHVTSALNVAVALTLAIAVAEARIARNARSKNANRILAGVLILMGTTWVALIGLHEHLEQYLDPATLSVRAGSEFYQYHRLYLWLSTVQWLGALVMSWIFLDGSHAVRPRK